IEQARKITGLQVAGESARGKPGQASAIVFTTDSGTFMKNAFLSEALFRPSTLVVGCSSADELESAARRLPGQLTATIYGTDEDLARHEKLVTILKHKAGRLIFNGFPTGVEVCPSMHHGGPYPATTDERFTSVGTASILRWARPVCYQNFPADVLPVELRNENALGLMRQVNGTLTREP